MVMDLTSTTTLMVRFKPGVDNEGREVILNLLGARVVDEIQPIGVLIISVPSRSLSIVRRILAYYSPLIDFIEEDKAVLSSLTPNDPYYSSEWHLQKINAPGAWDISTGSSSIIVAVLDSGVDPSHPDLKDRLVQGYNFYDNNYDTSDVYGHGTKVAGVIAAATNNGIGVASVGWSASIMPIRVTDASGYALVSLISKGLIYAADNGARVAVLSFQIFGGGSITSAAKYFFEKGGLIFAAGGNTGAYVGDPDNPYIISVSATSNADSIASFSTYGPFIDLSAPGVSIYTTVKGGGYGAVSGTSFSAPIAAGVAALIFSANPSLSPSDVELILKSTAVDLGDPGPDMYYGWGRIDASAALKATLPNSPPAQVDVTPPSVKITYPQDGATLSGSVTVKVDASDDGGVSRVELYINNNLFAIDSDPPYEFYWDTTKYSAGTCELKAKAYDISGNVGISSPIKVSISAVNTQPAQTINVKILSPHDGATISKTVYVQASVTSNAKIRRVELYVDNKLVSASTSQKSIYSFRLNTKLYKNGQHTITVKAYDSQGNSACASITIYISNR